VPTAAAHPKTAASRPGAGSPARLRAADSPFGQARLCYDHLAGRLGIAIARALCEHRALLVADGTPTAEPGRPAASDRFWQLGPNAAELLADLGVELAALDRPGRRPLLRSCLDWTEQQPHLAGALGAALADAMLADGWIARVPVGRTVEVTDHGARLLADRLGVRLETRS
jgi:hypothetical protein